MTITQYGLFNNFSAKLRLSHAPSSPRAIRAPPGEIFLGVISNPFEASWPQMQALGLDAAP